MTDEDGPILYALIKLRGEVEEMQAHGERVLTNVRLAISMLCSLRPVKDKKEKADA